MVLQKAQNLGDFVSWIIAIALNEKWEIDFYFLEKINFIYQKKEITQAIVLDPVVPNLL